MLFKFILVFGENKIKNQFVYKKEINMRQDNLCLIRQIELINDYILEECQENLFYAPRSNSCVFERIRNASMMLLNNATRLLRNQSPLIKSKAAPLTLEKTKELMFKMYKIIMISDFPIIKENKIKKVMENEFAVNPNELLLENPSDEIEEKKVHIILNGNI